MLTDKFGPFGNFNLNFLAKWFRGCLFLAIATHFSFSFKFVFQFLRIIYFLFLSWPISVAASSSPTSPFPSTLFLICRGCLKKSEIYQLSICRFVMNTISTSSQMVAGSPKSQFGKSQFFETPCNFQFVICSEAATSSRSPPTSPFPSIFWEQSLLSHSRCEAW